MKVVSAICVGVGVALLFAFDSVVVGTRCAGLVPTLPTPVTSLAAPVTASLYQFSFGSPRHSPTVAKVYPRPLAVSIMNCASWWTVYSWTSCARASHCEEAGEFLDRMPL